MTHSFRLAVFDLDGTLLSKSLPLLFSKWLFLKGHLSLRGLFAFIKVFLRYRFFSSKPKVFQEKLVALIDLYFTPKKLEILTREFLRGPFTRFLNPRVLRTLKRLQRAKVKTLLLSSSPEFLVRLVAKKLGFPDWKGTHYGVNPGEKRGELVILDGMGKRSFLESYLKKMRVEWREVLALSDSILDLPLLKAVGTPVVVNPAKALRKISKKEGWAII